MPLTKPEYDFEHLIPDGRCIVIPLRADQDPEQEAALFENGAQLFEVRYTSEDLDDDVNSPFFEEKPISYDLVHINNWKWEDED